MPPKRRQKQHKSHLEQSDYDSEAYHTDAAAQAYAVHAPNPPPRDSDELNLAVLRRWDPEVVAIKSKASMAVVYTCSTETGQWERADIEGPLFICELVRATLPIPDSSLLIERYKAVILNRKNMQNFAVDLKESGQLDVNDSLIMFSPSQPDEPLYGIWVYAGRVETDNQMTKIARTMFECAQSAEMSVELATAAVAESYEQGGFEGYNQQEQDRSYEQEKNHQEDRRPMQQAPRREEGQYQLHQSMPTAGQQIDMYQLFNQPRRQADPTETEIMMMRQQLQHLQSEQMHRLQQQHQQLQDQQDRNHHQQQQLQNQQEQNQREQQYRQEQLYHEQQQAQQYGAPQSAPQPPPSLQQNALLNLFKSAR
ncbi:hypothetical protein MBLNU457_1738t1 [Dothideomycetes sp. NU457]